MKIMTVKLEMGGSLKPGFLQKTGFGDVCITRNKGIYDGNNGRFAPLRKSLFGNTLCQQVSCSRKSLIGLEMRRSCIPLAGIELYKSAFKDAKTKPFFGVLSGVLRKNDKKGMASDYKAARIAVRLV